MSNKVDACHANSSSCLKSSSTFQAESVLETFLDVQLSFAYAFGYPMAVPLTLNQSCIASMHSYNIVQSRHTSHASTAFGVQTAV